MTHQLRRGVRRRGTVESMSPAVRKSIPITPERRALVAAIRTAGTPERAAAEAVAGQIPPHQSEARILAMLVDLGAKRIAEEVIQASYAAYAAALDDEDRATAAALRPRRDRLTD
ncbi:MAG: hypothetical protein LBG60_14305 [Bifidobacteriaceae bacterium]|nr:hypothetical protein [Bifidobacteriaceae bacterium]